jgi:hypothetical protein
MLTLLIHNIVKIHRIDALHLRHRGVDVLGLPIHQSLDGEDVREFVLVEAQQLGNNSE